MAQRSKITVFTSSFSPNFQAVLAPEPDLRGVNDGSDNGRWSAKWNLILLRAGCREIKFPTFEWENGWILLWVIIEGSFPSFDVTSRPWRCTNGPPLQLRSLFHRRDVLSAFISMHSCRVKKKKALWLTCKRDGEEFNYKILQNNATFFNILVVFNLLNKSCKCPLDEIL